ncbi:MAG: glycosyltransferase family 1 protein [Cyclobacteriaceae bacterium]
MKQETLKIILISVGTRGDMEPFLALAEYLKRRGHEVVVAFPEQFRGLAEDSATNFYSLGSEFMELMEGEDGKMIMGGKATIFQKFLALIRLYKRGVKVNSDMVLRQKELLDQEEPDRVIFHAKSSYPLIWEILNPGKTIMVSPIPCVIHPVKTYPHVGFNLNLGSTINRLTYKLANYGLLQNVMSSTKEIRKVIGVNRKQLSKSLLEIKMVYAVSSLLFQRQVNWPANVKLLGYHERDKKANWEADPLLSPFIEKYPKVLFVTFGSMSNPDPSSKTRVLLDILEKHEIPCIVNTAASGLERPDEYACDHIHFVEQIPYDWIFPKVHAVIHHGGSGTTHMALKYGCPSLIIPHIIDQFFWNRIVNDLGVGPKGMSITKINSQNLEPLILDVFQNEKYKKRALELASQMKEEDHREELFDFIES